MSLPRPLYLAVFAAIAWGIWVVGPTTLLGHLGEIIPRDVVTQPDPNRCYGLDYKLERDGQCIYTSYYDFLTLPRPAPVPLMEQRCFADTFFRPIPVPVLESDGLCHVRSGGDLGSITNDLVDVAEHGILGFLIVGGALLLWPRLKAMS